MVIARVVTVFRPPPGLVTSMTTATGIMVTGMA
jgi:hypothetical protein